ncbi:glycosyltransferase involved in cell wall biosynthesis [Hydrogenoanaerobacterium saccharovorans]|uniref:Glycosyltransferase involved in cell wall bisynthesis n=1 Tax=Hydrogenoanaerobacterium saccharovorans TaxID=474960 RepID=A0A1H8EF77_9FIRM|nr:glycosyltransferase [Hydrogenoanaerobacterium saccharovorans]RPF42138.1 glycosyltransferase involved in cell wall biosynthesis [Hydrogenoanaerobacterium saccharovorans]SEN18152.1 Glycosyltransferase involved in cell wall bisynthesis [Hydrogenoanaerobacterium saccharovorans]
MQKLKEIIIISSFVPGHNRSPVSVNKKMVQLCSYVFDKVTFITSNYPPEEIKELHSDKIKLKNINLNFNSNNILKTILNYIIMQIQIPKIVKKSLSDNSYIMFWLSGPMIIPFLYCKLKRLPIIGFLYGNSRYKSDHKNLFNYLKAALMKFIALNSDYICVESRGVARHWNIDFDKKQMNEIHLFVDTTRFKEMKPYIERKMIIGMCCRLVPSKKVLESICAFHLLKDDFPEMRLQIAGNGPLFNECQELIKVLGESDRIDLLGWIENQNLPIYFNEWRLLLNPTNYEGLPNSLIESMCCGTPSLSSIVGGIEDVIIDEKTGWKLEDSSPEGIAQSLKSILKTDNCIEISKAAREFVNKKYSYDSSLKNLRKFMDLLI